MPFQLEHITLAERVVLGCSCVVLAGEYGLITGLAQEYGTSRQFLYDLRDRTRAALEQALGPGRPGRPAIDQRLVVDRAAVERAVLVLHQVVHGSVRGIQECLAEILQADRSVGAIQAVVSAAAERARALAPVPSQPLVAVADELFAAGQPVLAVVDHASGLVAALEPATGRDETTWGCTYLDLAARGVAIGSLTADGARGLAGGAQAAGLPAPRLDHWHTLRDLGRVAHVLEASAYRLLTAADRGQRAVAAAQYQAEHGRRPRRGRPLQAPTDPASVAATTRAAAEAIERADGVAYLVGVVGQVLRPVEATTGRVHQAAEVTGDLTAAARLLRELGGRASAAATVLEERTAGLVGYLDDLDRTLAAPRAALGDATVTFLAWAWHHRHALGLRDAAAAWPAAPALAQQVWDALAATIRGSGMVENLNSVLAFARATHRGLPPTVLALAAVYRNHHRFRRGKRAAYSPLALAGLPSPHWLDALVPRRSPAPDPPAVLQFPSAPAKTVKRFAA